MEDREFLELGRDMLAALRDACMSSQETMSMRSGLVDAEEAYSALAQFLEPREGIVNPSYRDLHLAAAALFVIGADRQAYLEMMVGLDWSGDDWDLTTVRGAWRAGGFLSAVGDDNDYAIDVSDRAPRIGYQWSFDHWLPGTSPASMHRDLRGYAEALAAGSSPSP